MGRLTGTRNIIIVIVSNNNTSDVNTVFTNNIEKVVIKFI